jgi:hypothetical protein
MRRYEAYLLTVAVATVCIFAGDLNSIAALITNFFLISFECHSPKNLPFFICTMYYGEKKWAKSACFCACFNSFFFFLFYFFFFFFFLVYFFFFLFFFFF